MAEFYGAEPTAVINKPLRRHCSGAAVQGPVLDPVQGERKLASMDFTRSPFGAGHRA